MRQRDAPVTGAVTSQWLDINVPRTWSSVPTKTMFNGSPGTPSSFVVQHLRTGIRLADRYVVSLSIRNLGNALFAETQNAGFFRPEPGMD